MPADALDLSRPINLRAEMARRGLAPHQLGFYWSPDVETRLDPLDDAETRAEVRRFMAQLWRAAS
ncbi:MAG: hypothetical protein L0206_16815 [Actinobacteria bacterium]|nr:hypothetical protein [Actinomycetota bacterium]